ncbi:MAG: ABC transporter ATP-binding protein [Rhodobacteraceae bacterium]|nr:ABC transporter ATP-binding protein [Paracoccaceae bacterium]
MRMFRIDPYASAQGSPPQALGRFYHWCLRGSFPIIALGLFASMLAGSMEVLSSLLLGLVVDSAVESLPDQVFAENVFLLIFAVLFFLLARPIAFGCSSAVSSTLVLPIVSAQVLSRLHRHTLDQSVTFFDDDFAGRISQKQLQASRAVADTVMEVINVVAFALASLVGSMALLLYIDIRVALALAVWLAIYIILIRWFLPRIRMQSASRAGARSLLSGQIVDTLSNIRTVKMFAHHRHEDRAALDAMENFRQKAVGFGKVASSFRFCLMLLSGILPVLLVGGALWLWSIGVATAGDIAATGSVAIRIAQMSGWVSFTLMAVYSNVGEAEDGMKTLAFPHQMPDNPNAVELPELAGNITFRKVTFLYGNRLGGLNDVNLEVMPGEHIGLVGESGAGKSTLASLLMRLYDPESGIITIDGHDLRKVTQESLRRQISMVTQETSMFNRSVLENIAYGLPDATRDEVIEATRKAHAHEFVLDLRDPMGRKGYEAYLGERGVRLSGGQRQRIALARAVLKNAPILVLDEATSELDSTVEASIQRALLSVMEGKTVIAIAHRLSTIIRMNRIVVLHKGRIVEEGSYHELLAMHGHFASHWDEQVGGFIALEEFA